MVFAMSWGMSRCPGHLEAPWSYLVNTLLLLQFPLVHSWLLSVRGRALIGWIANPVLGTTVFATVASLQLMALFGLWNFSGIFLWEAQGALKSILLGLYGLAWLFVGKTMMDAGLGTQMGYLGWWSMFRGVLPNYGPMPVSGTFKYSRQPVYLAFTTTLWTVPIWTADQLFLAVCFTLYCVLGPRFKERRYREKFGVAFEEYQKTVPYFLPKISR